MIWIIGTGNIALEYAKVLKALEVKFLVVGRSEKNYEQFNELGAEEIVYGGLENYLQRTPQLPEKVIVAVNVEELSKVVVSIVEYGIKDVLCEKPGFCSPSEFPTMYEVVVKNNAKVYFAYNRRFYASTLAAEKIIEEDGGIKSFNFEFTEWGHVVEKLNYSSKVLENWFYGNSTHVIDLAFFLGGKPKEFNAYVSGELSWCKPAVFAGAGISEKGALFSYQANWGAPGRWGVEILTSKHRLYFRPMEKLQIQNIGSVSIEEYCLDDELDKIYKPGFFLETKAFVNNEVDRLCSIVSHKEHIKFYNTIVGKKDL